jgi:hypothetical protein
VLRLFFLQQWKTMDVLSDAYPWFFFFFFFYQLICLLLPLSAVEAESLSSSHHYPYSICHKKAEVVVGCHLHVLLLFLLMGRSTVMTFAFTKVVFIVMAGFYPLPSPSLIGFSYRQKLVATLGKSFSKTKVLF